MNLIVDDFLFLNIYIYIYSNSGHPAIAFSGSAALCHYPRLTTMSKMQLIGDQSLTKDAH